MATAGKILRSITGLRTGGRRAHASWPPAVIWIPAVVVAAGVLLPLAYLLIRTLGAGGEMWDLLLRTRTLEVLGRTLALLVAVTGTSVAISLPLAWLTTRTDLPFRRVWAVVTVLPLVIPSYVAGLVVVAALGPRGTLQQLLAPLGVERLPEIYGFPGATLTLALVSYPYLLLPLRAALQGADPSLEESARSLGQGPFRTFLRVTLPQLRPAMAAGCLLVALYALRDFGGVSLLRYETFTWAIYLQYQTSFDRVAAAALSLVLVVVAVGVLIIESRTRGNGTYHRSTVGTSRPPTLVKLGRWRWSAVAFCALVILFALMIPVSVLGYWCARALSSGQPLQAIWGPMANSAYVSGLATIATVAAAVPVAVLAGRYAGRATGLLERATYVGFALPGIVIAVALVFFAANYAVAIYQTLALLLFAYGILFLPQAVGAVKSSLLQVNPHLEEAARGLGRTPLGVLVSITVPLVRPGILAGGALVFLTTMKELPATLLLSPIGFQTLATSIWTATSEASFARAAVPALLLILVSSAPMAFLLTRDKKGNHE